MRKQYLPKSLLQKLYDALLSNGYKVVGPVVQDSAIIFKTQTNSDDLPWGWQEETAPGKYQLVHHENKKKRGFAWNSGPQGIKPWLFKPHQELWRAEETEDGLRFKATEQHVEPIAFIGIRLVTLPR